MAYCRRLFKRTWKETIDVWTSYRWWISLSGSVLGILRLVAGRGWQQIMNAQDLVVSGLEGVILAFAGTLIISLFRSPKLLDNDREIEISAQQQKNAELEATLARSPADEAKLAHVRNLLKDFSEDERCFLKWLLHNGEAARDKLASSPCLTAAVWSAHDKGESNGLLKTRIEYMPGGQKHFAAVNPNYADALKDVFFH